MDARTRKRAMVLLALVAFWLATGHAQTSEPTPALESVEPGSVTVTPSQIAVALFGFFVVGVPIAGGMLRKSILDRLDTNKRENDAAIEAAKKDNDAAIEAARLAAQRAFELKVQELTVDSQQTEANHKSTLQLADALSKLTDVLGRQMGDVGVKLDASTASSDKATEQSASISAKFDALQEYLIKSAGLPAEEAARAAKDINDKFIEIAELVRGLPEAIVAKIPPPPTEAQFAALLSDALASARQKLAQYQLVNTSEESDATKAAVISTAVSTAAATAAKAAQMHEKKEGE